MFTKTKLALCVAIVLGTASAALAASDNAKRAPAATGSSMAIQDQGNLEDSGYPGR
jgi:hypothetical protein